MIADLSLNPTHVRTHESRRAFEGCTLRSALQRVHCEERLLVCFASGRPAFEGPFPLPETHGVQVLRWLGGAHSMAAGG